MTALYEIRQSREILDEWLAESEGECTPELEALLAEVDASADEKIERVALYVRERLTTAAAVKTEVERLQAIQKRETKVAESLKAYLHREMERLGKEKVNGLLCTVALQKNPPSVQGEVDAAVLWGEAPNEWRAFIKYIPESFALDKGAVVDAYKLDQPIPNGLTVVRGTSLRIR